MEVLILGKSSKITDTEARLGNLLNNISTNVVESTVPQKINEAMKDVHIQTGVITRFYPYIDKANVKLDFSGKIILCKILHRYGGDILDLYTPSSAGGGYDSNVHEPFIVPKALQTVCVLKIQDSDSEENLILGYYQNEEIVGFNPAKPGNIKVTSLLEDGDEYWVKFGKNGLQSKLPYSPNRQIGSKFDEDGFEEVEYANSKEYYNKEEVDELLKEYEDRIKVLEEELNITPPCDDDTCDPNDNSGTDTTGTCEEDNNASNNNG